MVCLSRPYPFKFFKGSLPQILLGLLLNTLSHISVGLDLFGCLSHEFCLQKRDLNLLRKNYRRMEGAQVFQISARYQICCLFYCFVSKPVNKYGGNFKVGGRWKSSSRLVTTPTEKAYFFLSLRLCRLLYSKII